VADKELEATAKLVKRVMEGAAALSVPLTVETGSAQNWADAH
jgi:DNA polymerase-1